jgi:hypothetical protein
MNPERPEEEEKDTFSLEEAGRELFGESWKNKLSASIGQNEATGRRQAHRDKVRGPVQAAVVAWLVLKRGFGMIPPESPKAPFVSTLTGVKLPLEDDGVTDVVVIAEKLFGSKWKLPMADALGIDRTSLWRLTSSEEPSGAVVAALRAWMMIYRFAGIVPPFNLVRFPAPARLPDELSYRRRPDGTRSKKSKSRYAVLVAQEKSNSEDEIPAEVREVGE